MRGGRARRIPIRQLLIIHLKRVKTVCDECAALAARERWRRHTLPNFFFSGCFSLALASAALLFAASDFEASDFASDELFSSVLSFLRGGMLSVVCFDFFFAPCDQRVTA